MKRTNKMSYKSNLIGATPEQMERFWDNVVEAYQTLYRSVLERKIKEKIESFLPPRRFT